MALTLAEQRELPGGEVQKNARISDATPYGLRRDANKASAATLHCWPDMG